MATYRTSRTLPTILAVVVIILAIAGLVALARFLFFPGSSSSQVVVDTSREQLLDTTDGNSVSMTVRGGIVADENFRSYRITVSPTSRTLKTYTGYLGSVLGQQTLGNNVAAYEEFVHALDKANMSKGTPLAGERDDVRGICATGRVYQFTTLKDGEEVEMLWTSTCSGSPGSLKASTEQLSQLFRAQIPNSKTLISEISL